MKQRGFTLIELVVVIVILGILAATALPKFIDLSSDAENAAIQGVAANISSASSINYGARKVSPTNPATTAVDNCDDAGALLQGGLPTGYAVTASAVAANATADCTVTKTGISATATARVTGIN